MQLVISLIFDYYYCPGLTTIHLLTWVPQLILVGVKVLLCARQVQDVRQKCPPRTDPHHKQLVPWQMDLQQSKY